MSMIVHATVMLLGIFVASLAQVLLKKSAQQKYDNLIKEYFNWKVILGYVMMFSATLCTVFAYKVIPISLGLVLDSMGYIFVTVFGYFFFKESMSWKRFSALFLIVSGILVYALLG